MNHKIKAILDHCEAHGLEFVSYGLAPNPWGFCYERSDASSDEACKDLDRMLNGLSDNEENELKREVFG